jgi:hypothetical protein
MFKNPKRTKRIVSFMALILLGAMVLTTVVAFLV